MFINRQFFKCTRKFPEYCLKENFICNQLINPRHNAFRAFRNSARQQQIRPVVPENFASGGGPIPRGNVAKAIIFTGVFSTGCILTTSILKYENTRSDLLERARESKMKWFMKKSIAETQTKWQQIKRELEQYFDKLSIGNKVFIPICAINILVFCLWRFNASRGLMMKYFVSNPASKTVCSPMLLSTFSHYSGFHLFANMYVLHSFCTVAVAVLGKEQFLGVYLSAGVIASLASILYKAAMSSAGYSLGASGAIMAILAYVCTQYPDTQLNILFLPTFTFSAGAAIKVILGFDFAGLLLGWKLFDHAAHLGGALFGIFWAYYGASLLLPFLRSYHEFRKTKP